MSKLTGELSYKDWMIVKHGLQKSIKEKEQKIFIDGLTSWEPCKLTQTKKEKLEKEIREEEATLEKVTKLTDNFKDYIEGKERHYMHRPNDCD